MGRGVPAPSMAKKQRESEVSSSRLIERKGLSASILNGGRALSGRRSRMSTWNTPPGCVNTQREKDRQQAAVFTSTDVEPMVKHSTPSQKDCCTE